MTKKRIPWPLIFLALLFIAPVLVAAYLLNTNCLANLKTVQYGKFVQAPYSVELPVAEYLAGDSIHNKWVVAYIMPYPCTAECMQNIKALRKLHIALGAERDRVTILTSIQQEDIYPGSVLILDTHGLYIMGYEKADHNGLLKDMRRLLKYSHA